MSFLKISDPVKRDLIVKEYLELKKNIRDNLLSERTGEQQLQTDLSKIFKPITETQKATAREIMEDLKPIKEGIENLPQAITFPAYPSIQAVEGEETIIPPYFIGDIAQSFLRKFITKNEADRTYGIYDKNGQLYIGKKKVYIKENDIMVKDGEEYEGTPGLWELIVSKNPNKPNINDVDKENYARLLVKTSSIYRDNNANSNHPKGNRRGPKWKSLVKNIWTNREKYLESGGERIEVIVIPSDPNALLEKLDLLLSSQEAGHTNVGNELVSICDELKRQGVLDTKTYEKINSIIKK